MDQNLCWGSMPKRLSEAGEDPVKAANLLLDELSEREILRLLSGSRHLHQEIAAGLTGRYNFVPCPAADVPRLGFPGVRFSDGPRGVVVGHSTAFPCAMGRGATFDPELERRVGDAIGHELTAQGANYFAGICINLLRHPAWGRAQETYGEDSFLLGEMGAALTQSVGKHTATCVKHFACNSMENSRFQVNVKIEEADLRDFYLPHFRRCVEAGVDSVMSSYNMVNGEWCGHHRHLLTEILRDEWKFDGFVMSDFFLGVRDMAAGLNGGLDLEMPMRWRGLSLARAVAKGKVSRDTVRKSAYRIVRAMFAACQRTKATQAPRSVVHSEKHLALSRETARRAIVLLQNNEVEGRPVLPILGAAKGGNNRKIALIGRLANVANTGDLGSSKVRSPHVATAAEGFTAIAPKHGVELHTSLSDNVASARKAATGADTAIVVVGNTWRDEGEYIFVFGGDRKQLRLSPAHEQLIEAVAATCPRTVVVLVGGSAFICEAWRQRVPAILMGWFSGAEGGHALAEILFGEYAPGGRLPCTWPKREDQLPPFSRKTKEITYGPLHGYRMFHAKKEEPAFWFGHGLSYVPIEWGAAVLRKDSAGTFLEVPLHNPAPYPQREVVQAYIDLVLGSHPEALPTLVGFTSIEIPAKADRLARVQLDEALLKRASSNATVYVGHSAGNLVQVGSI